MAALFGCVLGIPEPAVAITLVALGTSLPDTFASIGNVTGSNSVNVFLGLGLPWTIGSIYWAIKGADSKWETKFGSDPDIPERFRTGAFIVKASTLTFSVLLFTGCALTAMIMLYVRRR